MRHVIGFIACTVLASVCLGADPETPATDGSLSAQPAAPAVSATSAAAPASATAPTATAPTATAPTASAPTASTRSDNTLSDLHEKHFKSEGYSVKMRNGGKLYCRTDVGTGSHIPKEQCYAEDVLVSMETLTPGTTSATMGISNQSLPKSFGSGH
jgi:hypothetical protein